VWPIEDLETAVREGRVDVAFRRKPLRRPPFPDERAADWEAIYRQGSAYSREALDYVERLCAHANARVLTRPLWGEAEVRQRPDPIRLVAEPVRGEDRGGLKLAVFVPLVLVLMTITGAVYPAIDLTAGERERGTLEVLIAAPVPRVSLLFGKYVAVM